MQHVRRAALDERLPLLDAEAVLLVDDGHGEVGELDLPLDQRVRADGDLRRARGDLGPHLHGAGRAGEQDAAHAERSAQRLEREEVLLGERLGRRHQRALPPDLDRPQQRVERDDRLARADVTLQQPLHRHGAAQVDVDLADRLLLVRRELERERLAVAVEQLARRRERHRDRVVLVGARDDQLQRDQLVERQPPARLLGLLPG